MLKVAKLSPIIRLSRLRARMSALSCATEHASPGARDNIKRYVNSPVMVAAVPVQYERHSSMAERQWHFQRQLCSIPLRRPCKCQPLTLRTTRFLMSFSFTKQVQAQLDLLDVNMSCTLQACTEAPAGSR